MMTNFLAYSTDVPANIGGQIGYGLGVTAIGVIIVFAVLILIMFVIYLFQGIFGQKSKPAKVQTPPAPAVAPAPVAVEPSKASEVPTSSENDGQLVAVLAAAIAAYEGCDPATSRYRIRSFRRVL